MLFPLWVLESEWSLLAGMWSASSVAGFLAVAGLLVRGRRLAHSLARGLPAGLLIAVSVEGLLVGLLV